MSKQRKRKQASAPISAHPAFPAIVALWFAALLGLGSLVLPAVLFERLSEASGLASLLPAAQPPLGLAARLMIAVAAASVGALAGLVIARRAIAGTQQKPATAVGPGQPEKVTRPIRAHYELGEEGFDAELDELPYRKPAAGGEWKAADAGAPPELMTPGPLDLAAFAASDEKEVDAGDWITEDREREARHQAEVAADGARWACLPELEPDAAKTVEQLPGATQPAEGMAARPLAELGMVELVERFARALQVHRDNAEKAASVQGDTVVDLTAALTFKAAEQTFAGKVHWDEDCAPAGGAAPPESYSSLLAMKSRSAASRHRAPPAVARETEQALRDALEKLQAMSGAA